MVFMISLITTLSLTKVLRPYLHIDRLANLEDLKRGILVTSKNENKKYN